MPPTGQQRTMNILFANDGSTHALAALELIIDLPLPSETIVHAIGVLIPRDSSNHAVLENVLADTKQRLEKKPVIARTEIKLGYPQEILIEYAEELHPDLIIIGAKGLRATLRILLGGVAQQIVEYATRPVLIVRAPYKRIRRVALVTDGSIYSDYAIDYLGGTITKRDEPMECAAFPFH